MALNPFAIQIPYDIGMSIGICWYLNDQKVGAFAVAFGSGQRLALREKLQQGADHPASGAACARFRLRVLQAETMRQSGHAAGKVARVHGKRDGLGFEEALEDSRQGAGLLILQRVQRQLPFEAITSVIVQGPYKTPQGVRGQGGLVNPVKSRKSA